MEEEIREIVRVVTSRGEFDLPVRSAVLGLPDLVLENGTEVQIQDYLGSLLGALTNSTEDTVALVRFFEGYRKIADRVPPELYALELHRMRRVLQLLTPDRVVRIGPDGSERVLPVKNGRHDVLDASNLNKSFWTESGIRLFKHIESHSYLYDWEDPRAEFQSEQLQLGF